MAIKLRVVGRIVCRKVYDYARSIDLKEIKPREACRRFYDYVRYDLKEIAFPSPMPNPPGRKIYRKEKVTLYERYLILKEATRLYCASFKRFIGPDLCPGKYKEEEAEEADSAKEKEEGPGLLDDLLFAARGGAETLRPALHRVYMTKASVFTDALKSFVQGYQEGVREVMAKNEETKAQQDGSTPKKSI